MAGRANGAAPSSGPSSAFVSDALLAGQLFLPYTSPRPAQSPGQLLPAQSKSYADTPGSSDTRPSQSAELTGFAPEGQEQKVFIGQRVQASGKQSLFKFVLKTLLRSVVPDKKAQSNRYTSAYRKSQEPVNQNLKASLSGTASLQVSKEHFPRHHSWLPRLS